MTHFTVFNTGIGRNGLHHSTIWESKLEKCEKVSGMSKLWFQK